MPLLLRCCLPGLLMIPGQALASSGALPSLVQDIGICIVLAGVLAIVFTRLKIPEIAAFLIAGVVVGPVGAGLVTDPANIETISELGLILLLYLIGLEIDIRKLFSSGRILVVSGLLQYPITILFGVVAALLLLQAGIGGELLQGGYVPLYIGFIVAASSTLLVVKLFQESFQLDTEAGHIALGLLIFQDFWAIAVLAVQPSFNAPEIGPVLLSLAGIAVLTLMAAMIARFIIPVGFRWVARRPEVVFAGAVSWCFLVVLLGVNLDFLSEWLLGINLHMAVGPEMGALIAGATIASLPYSTEIMAKVSVVKDFFVTLFFVGLGMSIPMPDGVDVMVVALLLVVITVLARYLVFLPLLYFTGLDRRNAVVVATRLGQVSEFSLVIGFIGVNLGHISAGLNSAIIFAFVITALATPAMFHYAHAVHDLLAGVLERIGFREPPSREAGGDESYSLALLGFHRVASSLLYEIGRSRPELLAETLIVDFNINLHPRIAALGPTVRYGDLCSPETLLHAGVDKAKVVACTIPDDVLKGTTNLKIVTAVRQMNPGAIIIANAIELADSARLYDAGADYVFLQRIETARAVDLVITKALAGEIQTHRETMMAAYGVPGPREEVM
jgi:Kef-type K+ transport system membrane component KefB